MATELSSKRSETVKVVVRVRPMSETEKMDERKAAATVNEERGEITLVNPEADDGEPPKVFTFDASFGPTARQRDIYERTAAPIVDSVLEGYNGTVFAYGQTGAGKTHTMEGIADPPELRGIMPNSFKHIFERISGVEDKTTQFLVRASYLEIYNEEIRDLLSKDPKNNLELKESVDSGVYVKDLTSFVVRSAAEVDAVLQAGKKNRVTGATLMNAQSSRSHAIFSVTVETSSVKEDGKAHIRVGKLNMVDLAGSERQSKTGATGQRLKEATKINLSLSALGNVIAALVDSRSSHVPYRDSKLTRLLQDSLGGNTRTVMIANCGPADYNYEETLSTLRYADRAKRIKNKPKINEDPKDAMLREFQEEIERLRRALAEKEAAASASETVMIDGKEVVVPVAGVVETRIVEKVVGMSEEERKRLEEEMRREKDELERRAMIERERLLQDKAKSEEERERLRRELEDKLEAHRQAESERETLMTQLTKMQEKLLMGGKMMDKASKQEAELRRAQRELEERKQQEARLAHELEEANMLMEEQYNSLAEEAEGLRRKLRKVHGRYEALKRDMQDREAEVQDEKEDLLEAIRQLNQATKLKQLLLDLFVPPQELERLEAAATWDEESGEWSIRSAELAGNRLRPRRPLATPGARRAESGYAHARQRYDGSARYTGENVAHLDLDPTDRTTTTLEAGARERVSLLVDDGPRAVGYVTRVE